MNSLSYWNANTYRIKLFNWSRTSAFTLFQLMDFQCWLRQGVAPVSFSTPVICLFHYEGSPDSLAIRHLLAICSVSGRKDFRVPSITEELWLLPTSFLHTPNSVLPHGFACLLSWQRSGCMEFPRSTLITYG